MPGGHRSRPPARSDSLSCNDRHRPSRSLAIRIRTRVSRHRLFPRPSSFTSSATAESTGFQWRRGSRWFMAMPGDACLHLNALVSVNDFCGLAYVVPRGRRRTVVTAGADPWRRARSWTRTVLPRRSRLGATRVHARLRAPLPILRSAQYPDLYRVARDVLPSSEDVFAALY